MIRIAASIVILGSVGAGLFAQPGQSTAPSSLQNPAPVQNPAPAPSAIPTPSQLVGAQSAAEQKELLDGLTDAGQSAVDITRFLEAFIKKHPDTAQRKDLDNVLARAAIESKDDRRTVLYGQRALASTPDDILLLDRVARSLLTLAGEPAASEQRRRIPLPSPRNSHRSSLPKAGTPRANRTIAIARWPALFYTRRVRRSCLGTTR
jgi:hypothetical protein